MEIFINEHSLHGQYQTQTEFATAIREFMGVFSVVSEKQVEAYKNNMVLLNRPAFLNEKFVSSLERLADKSLKVAFKEIVFNKTNPKDWQQAQVHDNTQAYACFQLDDFVDGTTLAEVAERTLVSGEVERVLVNFCPCCFSGGGAIEVLKNNEETSIALPWVETKSELERWFPAVRPESLLESPVRFRRTSYLNPKTNTPIFEELATRHFWAFDNFHRNHFEVWDSQKNHLGEADLNLILDRTKNDPNKDGKLPF